jgi:hypothetical protein
LEADSKKPGEVEVEVDDDGMVEESIDRNLRAVI